MIIGSNYIKSAVVTRRDPNPKCRIKLIKKFELPYNKIKQYIESVTLIHTIPMDTPSSLSKSIEYIVEEIIFIDGDLGGYSDITLNFNTTNDERVKALLKLYE